MGSKLIEAFDLCKVTFLIGGLDFADNRNAVKVISNAAAESEPELIKKLRGIDGHDGYVLKSGEKLMIMLPDDPEQIEAIAQGELSGYLKYYVKTS